MTGVLCTVYGAQVYFKFQSSNILIWRTHIDILMLGKCNPLSQLREHDEKIQITHADHYRESDNFFFNKREKGRYLTQSYNKSPYTSRNVKRQSDNTYNATKKFDYTAVADRLRTVSWSNYGHPTCVVNLVYRPNLPTPRNSRVIKRTHV